MHTSTIFASTGEKPGKQPIQQHELEAKTEHLRLILNQASFVFLGNVFASVTFVVGCVGRIPLTPLLVWGVAIIGFNLLRLLTSQRFPAGLQSEQTIDVWEKRLLFSTFVSGSLWGLAGGLFFLPGQVDHNFFISILVIGMGAAATSSHSFHRVAYPVFVVPAIAPLVLNLWAEPSLAAKGIALVTPCYFFFMYLLSQRIYQAVHVAILSGFTNQYYATHDYLTGIANRRAFQDALDREWARALRDGMPLSLCIADIDDFKRYNDEHGHATGDEVLKYVANMIHTRIRSGSDLVARIGGEEFAVILSETHLADAHAVAESINARAQDFRLQLDETIVPPTLSIGVCSLFPKTGIDSARLFNCADQALYNAKNGGKNMVVVVSDAVG